MEDKEKYLMTSAKSLTILMEFASQNSREVTLQMNSET